MKINKERKFKETMKVLMKEADQMNRMACLTTVSIGKVISWKDMESVMGYFGSSRMEKDGDSNIYYLVNTGFSRLRDIVFSRCDIAHDEDGACRWLMLLNLDILGQEDFWSAIQTGRMEQIRTSMAYVREEAEVFSRECGIDIFDRPVIWNAFFKSDMEVNSAREERELVRIAEMARLPEGMSSSKSEKGVRIFDENLGAEIYMRPSDHEWASDGNEKPDQDVCGDYMSRGCLGVTFILMKGFIDGLSDGAISSSEELEHALVRLSIEADGMFVRYMKDIFGTGSMLSKELQKERIRSGMAGHPEKMEKMGQYAEWMNGTPESKAPFSEKACAKIRKCFDKLGLSPYHTANGCNYIPKITALFTEGVSDTKTYEFVRSRVPEGTVIWKDYQG